MTNRAVYVLPPGGLNNLESRTIETPGPGAGEVTIAIHANSLNHHDYLVATGEIATDGPRILLSDAAGEVVAVGDGVTQFSVGDRVMSTYLPHWRSGTPDFDGFGNSPGDGVDGFARDTVTVPVSAVTVMPRNYTYEEAATLPTAGLSAWRALFAGVPIIPGSSVLIPGTSTVALFAVQLAKAVGAQVIATSSAPDKMARLVELGADHVVNYRERPDWGSEAMRLSGGIDLVLDVGGAVHPRPISGGSPTRRANLRAWHHERPLVVDRPDFATDQTGHHRRCSGGQSCTSGGDGRRAGEPGASSRHRFFLQPRPPR